MIARYWARHLIVDPLASIMIAAGLWFAPLVGAGPYFQIDPSSLGDVLSRWLPGSLTLIGLIIATTGFLTSLMQNDDFAPLAKSSSVSQLWEILRQNLGWLFVACVYAAIGTFSDFEGSGFLIFAVSGTAILTMVIITLAKLVWLMRSVLFVKISKSRKSTV